LEAGHEARGERGGEDPRRSRDEPELAEVGHGGRGAHPRVPPPDQARAVGALLWAIVLTPRRRDQALLTGPRIPLVKVWQATPNARSGPRAGGGPLLWVRGKAS